MINNIKTTDEYAMDSSIIQIYNLLNNKGKELMVSFLPNSEVLLKEFKKDPESFSDNFAEIVKDNSNTKITKSADGVYRSSLFNRIDFVKKCKNNLSQLVDGNYHTEHEDQKQSEENIKGLIERFWK